MAEDVLNNIYRNYIACLNKQDWSNLGTFVDDDVLHNGQRLGLEGYREMLEKDFSDIPDLYFEIQRMIADAQGVASRLGFHCTPQGTFLGLPVNGKKVRFTENVFYAFKNGKIDQVWSIIDKLAIEAQL